jgi:hypothetical protein
MHRHYHDHVAPRILQASMRRYDAKLERSAEGLLNRLWERVEMIGEEVMLARAERDRAAMSMMLKEERISIVKLGQAAFGMWTENRHLTLVDARVQIQALRGLSTPELRQLAGRPPLEVDVSVEEAPRPGHEEASA